MFKICGHVAGIVFTCYAFNLCVIRAIKKPESTSVSAYQIKKSGVSTKYYKLLSVFTMQ